MDGPTDVNAGNRRDIWFEWAQKIKLPGTAPPLPAAGDSNLFNVPFCDGRTPLIAAIQAKQHDLVTEIINCGADFNLHDLEGKTPLIHAIETEQLNIVNFLLKSGCNPNKSDANGRTPLMYAVYNGHEENVRAVAKAGGNGNDIDFDSRTVLDYAVHKWGWKKSYELFQELRFDIPYVYSELKRAKTRYHYASPEYVNYSHAKDIAPKYIISSILLTKHLHICFMCSIFYVLCLVAGWWIICGICASIAFYYAIRTRFYYELTFKQKVKADLANFSSAVNAQDFDRGLASHKQSRAVSNALRYATRKIALGYDRTNVRRHLHNIDYLSFYWLIVIFLAVFLPCFLSYIQPLFYQRFFYHGTFDFFMRQILCAPFIVVVIYYFLLVPITFLTKRWLSKLQKRRSEMAAQFRDRASRQSALKTIADAPFALFLRSFQQDEKLQIAGVDFEAVLVYSVGQLCEVVALGGQEEKIGAIKIPIAGENWQKLFSHLAKNAKLIFMIPYNTPGVVWEIQYILAENIADKVIFVMPPAVFLKNGSSSYQQEHNNDQAMEEAWSDLSKNAALAGVEFPFYFARGCIFTLENDGIIRDWDALGMEMLPWLIATLSSSRSRSESTSDRTSTIGIPGMAENLDLDDCISGDSLSIIDLSGAQGGSESGWSSGDTGGSSGGSGCSSDGGGSGSSSSSGGGGGGGGY